MTSQTRPSIASDDMKATSGPELTREDVAHYLHTHRDFFVHHPGLIETLAIPHDSGEAVSLVERQIAMLRERNRELDRKLYKLIAVAAENEKASRRLHNLVLKVMPIEGFEESLAAIRGQLQADFPDTVIRICLLDTLPATSVSDCAMMDVDLHRSRLVEDLFSDKYRGVVFLTEHQIEAVFTPGEDSQPVCSAASVALKDARHLGVLFLGSPDACHYQSGIGTLFLESLGEIISAKLQPFASG